MPLLRSGALQNAVITSTNFSIIATDARGIIQLFNVGAERMLGYSAYEVVNKIYPTDIFDPDEVTAHTQALSSELGLPLAHGFEALAYKALHGIEDVYELTFICKGGNRLPAIVSITALHDEQRTIIGYLLIGTDNSLRKRIESELSEAIAVAEKANQAKSDFLTSMSHELRTPLSAILGFAQLIDSGSPPPTLSQKRSIEQILHAGWYLLDLINEILDLALIESGKLSISLESVSLSEVLYESRALIETQAEKQNISINFPPYETTHYILADKTRMKQVLSNLLTNGIKYNQPDGFLTVTYTLITPERVRICVEDTGEGLPSEKIAQLFQPFNRLGQESSGEEGTGIGLVMTKRLVELMGGKIGMESRVGKGSTFWVDMNLANEQQPALNEDDQESIPRFLHNSTQVYTLLYVEDNPANLMLVEELVARRTDSCLLSARDGLEGVKIARASKPDVILMDINLPGISGLKALEILRKDPATAHIPVVAISANAMPRDIHEGLKAGFFSYLTKPLKINAFMGTVDAAIEHSKVHLPQAGR
jgi:PAS domain S-box-containing protein